MSLSTSTHRSFQFLINNELSINHCPPIIWHCSYSKTDSPQTVPNFKPYMDCLWGLTQEWNDIIQIIKTQNTTQYMVDCTLQMTLCFISLSAFSIKKKWSNYYLCWWCWGYKRRQNALARGPKWRLVGIKIRYIKKQIDVTSIKSANNGLFFLWGGTRLLIHTTLYSLQRELKRKIKEKTNSSD